MLCSKAAVAGTTKVTFCLCKSETLLQSQSLSWTKFSADSEIFQLIANINLTDTIVFFVMFTNIY